ncbi:type VI secretion system baseplate subunit TssG [Erwinia sp. B116]|uniref:type VI secretion system baseplate subunit TssG n=1 Tax=Erwinia sp. B116 TaxID=1561024 RepID=UPI00130471E8|nr:type VI secretion system baseplate subunit TssG [Erwinia sp. B116]
MSAKPLPPLAWGTFSADRDFFALLREFEHLCPGQPQLGESRDGSLSRIRITQRADAAFAPREVADVQTNDGRLEVITRYFGFFAPYGPLPLYVTEHAHAEAFSQRNRAFEAFMAIFSQRLALFFYRAWSQLNPIVGHDRPPEQNRFDRRLRMVAGIPAAQPLETHLSRLRLAWPGAWLPGRGSVAELQRMLTHYFSVPVRVRTRQGRWIGDEPGVHPVGNLLGATRLGRRFYDAQHAVRIDIGPLDASEYSTFQRGAPALLSLAHCCRAFFRHRYVMDIVLLIRTSPAMACRLGQGRAGRSGWLQAREKIVSQPVWYSTT